MKDSYLLLHGITYRVINVALPAVVCCSMGPIGGNQVGDHLAAAAAERDCALPHRLSLILFVLSCYLLTVLPLAPLSMLFYSSASHRTFAATGNKTKYSTLCIWKTNVLHLIKIQISYIIYQLRFVVILVLNHHETFNVKSHIILSVLKLLYSWCVAGSFLF